MTRADPKNLLVKNNLASVSLLLKTNSIRAHQWAAEVYAKYPTNGAVASTYAFSLYTQGKPAEGLAALGKLTEPDLQQPSTAAYYALLLSVSGDVEKAGRYRAIAERAPLLPEEKALLGHVEERSSVPK